MYNKLDSGDFGTLCICAIRYSLGRKTPSPIEIIHIVQQNIADISKDKLVLLKRMCETQDRSGIYNDEYYERPVWSKFKDSIKRELERREREGIT